MQFVSLAKSNYCTHILNGCQSTLQQGRYTWRHDSFVYSIFMGLKQFIPSGCDVQTNVDNLRANDNLPATIPPCILYTALRPGMVAVWNGKRSIHLLELTIPDNSSTGLQEANSRKRNKQEYLSLVGDLECLGWLVRYTTLELSSLGHFLQTSNDSINYFLPAMDRCDIRKILIRSAKLLPPAHTKLL